ncbi:acetyltransferase (GNAT) family protein [Mucilaginibacter frigoritolerans]|uniref:Acetyltransferase (GNAT) family protein n=1 Tax=Mucilaginibacter frigoritolerans TaxID=652788 RepID=A0A562UFS8_9SPHI|nr:GNAT family N-acetyltransferase [Mucilaginibacter frigoritolerans]TWJ04692.1 acetyltransferase (GNAT) family protein [Mucilaginibacter frigoritolerans]
MIQTRPAGEGDIPAMIPLIYDLGYPAPADEIKVRLENILRLKEFRTLLAVTDDGQIVGMIGMTENYGYEHNAKYIRVLALVTGKDFRNMGVGKVLMMEAEKWATEIDAYMIVLTSGMRDERKTAHAFYQHIGYELKSYGFVKRLK